MKKNKRQMAIFLLTVNNDLVSKLEIKWQNKFNRTIINYISNQKNECKIILMAYFFSSSYKCEYNHAKKYHKN